MGGDLLAAGMGGGQSGPGGHHRRADAAAGLSCPGPGAADRPGGDRGVLAGGGLLLLRILGGFLLACVLAVALAALSARLRWVRDLLSPLVAVVKAVPVVSFIILALIFFSSENLSLLISALMVFPPVYLNVLEGIGHTDVQLLEMARVFRVPLARQLRGIYLPAVLPYFRSAVSLGLGLCWKSGAAAEVIGLPDGSIGERLYEAKVYLNTPDLFAWTVVIVLVSLVFEKLFLFLLDRLVARLERAERRAADGHRTAKRVQSLWGKAGASGLFPHLPRGGADLRHGPLGLRQDHLALFAAGVGAAGRRENPGHGGEKEIRRVPRGQAVRERQRRLQHPPGEPRPLQGGGGGHAPGAGAGGQPGPAGAHPLWGDEAPGGHPAGPVRSL